jgi:hypothetical protein
VTVLENVQQLAGEFPGVLIGVSEFAQLLGLDKTGEAALRAARQRPLSLGAREEERFPAAVAESGRSIEHRLEDLVRWVTTTGWLDSGRSGRRGDEVVSSRAVAGWRLRRLLLDRVEHHGTPEVRAELARYVLDPSSAELPGVVRDAAATARGFDGLLDDVLVDLGRGQPGIPNRASSAIALLTVMALDVPDDAVVHDATCGECEILTQTWQFARPGSRGRLVLTGNDLDERSMVIGEARLALAGVRAELRVDPAANSVDRLVIDPGWDAKLPSLFEYVRKLKRDGAIAIVTRLHKDVANLVDQVPPHTIVIPPQRVGTSHGPVAIWVSQPLQDPPKQCRVVDLRRETTNRPELERRVEKLWEALEVRHPVPDLTQDRGSRQILDEAAPILLGPRDVIDIPSNALTDRLTQLIDGRRGYSDSVIDENRTYALALASELKRLIDADQGPERNRLVPERPTESPDGVVAHLTTSEARRVLDRLVTHLDGGSTRRSG